jgi:protein-S-isoprenylcysteine O-methyltransferase Ste14
MSTSEAPDSQPSKKGGIPRWAAPIVVIGGTLAVHVALPWAISLIMPRYGWVEGHPGWWNWIGLLPVAAGLVMIAWGASLHIVTATGPRVFERTPRYMLVKGPYRFSRNPMYLLELAMWLGWAIFYGSIAVLIAFALWWIFFAFLAVPYEERQLEARYGEMYLQYKNTIPRWFGLPRRDCLVQSRVERLTAKDGL